MIYRQSAVVLGGLCSRGHFSAQDPGDSGHVYCLHGECAAWTGVWDGEEGALRRVRRVFAEALTPRCVSAHPSGLYYNLEAHGSWVVTHYRLNPLLAPRWRELADPAALTVGGSR